MGAVLNGDVLLDLVQLCRTNSRAPIFHLSPLSLMGSGSDDWRPHGDIHCQETAGPSPLAPRASIQDVSSGFAGQGALRRLVGLSEDGINKYIYILQDDFILGCLLRIPHGKIHHKPRVFSSLHPFRSASQPLSPSALRSISRFDIKSSSSAPQPLSPPALQPISPS